MKHITITPVTAVREDKRQAHEALGQSFCKTLAELITNSDSSAKRKHRLSHCSGLVDLMLNVPKGHQLDTASLKASLNTATPTRSINVEVITTGKLPGRKKREIVVSDNAQGMSGDGLKTALEEIGGDRIDLACGSVGRNLFGRGLSDVMRAHTLAEVHTYDGNELTTARGSWSPRWQIALSTITHPTPADFENSLLDGNETGTAVRFVAENKKFHIPDMSSILERLANFYMLRLIAADSGVVLNVTQYRAAGPQAHRVVYDFPVGQVVDSFTRHCDSGHGRGPLRVDFLLARSEHKLVGAGQERDLRENGLLIVDNLDAVYDLTFADQEYEKAPFLAHIFGLIRINGLREVLEHYLNQEHESPLRVERDGFNLNHEFSKALMDFLAKELRPYYEQERKRLEEQNSDRFSRKSQKKIEEALKHLNKYFSEITSMTGSGHGASGHDTPVPADAVSFFPPQIRLTEGHARRVLLLIRDDVVANGSGLVASASEGFTVHPETERIYRKETPRWSPHEMYYAIPFEVSGGEVGQQGEITALVETIDDRILEATLRILDVLEEREITAPDEMEFRPGLAKGAPNRRHSIVLWINPQAVSAGHWIHFRIAKRTGAVTLIDQREECVEEMQIKLQADLHCVRGQEVFRVRVPWQATAWNQNATVIAWAKTALGRIQARGRIELDEPDPIDGGFFKEVRYDELDGYEPSMYAAGVITVNTLDPLNQALFGSGDTREEAQRSFDARIGNDPAAQQRLATLLVEEMCFRALEQWSIDNKLPLPKGREVSSIRSAVAEHKFSMASKVFTALVK